MNGIEFLLWTIVLAPLPMVFGYIVEGLAYASSSKYVDGRLKALNKEEKKNE